jgi:5-oxoprolinase (ATP-hydrolysing)
MWRISIDTGGTFTDCIAENPAGELYRAKVLSNSRLRGVIIEEIAPDRYRFTHNWRTDKDIFKGYECHFPGADSLLQQAPVLVENIDFQQNIISLSSPLTPHVSRLDSHPSPLIPHPSPLVPFEITAREEAPLLAARLVTGTPLDQPLPPMEMRLGTTKGTNALLEKKGARTVLLITEGFGDLLCIGTQQRPHLFQLNIPEPVLLYDRVIEVNERLDVAGNILKPLTNRKLAQITEAVINAGVDAVAIALLHAWRNPAHELALKKALMAAGVRFVTTSHELMPAIKILPRAQTAVVDAYLSPVLTGYLDKINAVLPLNQSRLRIMTSAGGLSARARFYPKDSLLSGPAGGVAGASEIAQSLDFQKVITLDMGGTSTDVARYDGQPDYEFTTRIAGVEMHSPCLAIETVAAGGGSICYFDGQQLRVGPASAGASPGPACYGGGGPLAVTDVNLLLGKLDPSAMGIPVHRDKAEAALQAVLNEVVAKTGQPCKRELLLRDFEKIANETIADAIRKISVAKGFDPKDYALLGFGGAGGLHACKIAELLGITTVLLPYDGGVLSAYGIHHAAVERFAQRQVLEQLIGFENRLPEIFDTLTAEATAVLQQEGFSMEEIEVKNRLVFLRFKGQDSALQVDYQPLIAIESVFETEYRRLFGHFPGNREVEVESVKVVVRSKRIPPTRRDVLPEGAGRAAPANRVHEWDALRPGQTLDGEAILLNPNSTAFLENNWRLEVGEGKNLILRYLQPLDNQLEKEGDGQISGAALLTLFTNRFKAIAEEMGAQLQRTAFSVNVKERLDFSCALLDAAGELLVNAPHIPVHLGSLGICARLVKAKLPLGPGDVVITNHPKYGGSHLPDVTLLSAVHDNNPTAKIRNQLIGYVINRAHHAEIGGKRPGSMPPDATCLEEEGVVFAPTYLVKNGELQWQVVEELLIGSPWPTRSLQENLADINAALASLRTGEEKLRQLVKTHGLATVQHFMSKLKETAALVLKTALQPFDNQVFYAKERLDDGHEIAVKISLENGPVTLDFSGTSGVHPHNLNANVSIVYSVVMYVLRLLCRQEIPLNEGLMRNVRLVLPPGTFLHPDFDDNPARCPAVVGGNTEVSQRLTDTLLKALSPILKTACSQGTMNNFLFGNQRFGYYETIGGGAGAGDGFAGRSAVHQHMTNTKITDPEELEFRYPVRLLRFAIRRGSGGEGRWSGGDGIVRMFEFLEAMEITILGQHRLEAPYGLAGGQPGTKGRTRLKRKGNARWKTLQGVDSQCLVAGDVVVVETPGGGGYGAA